MSSVCKPATLPSFADDCLGAKAGVNNDAFGFGFLDFFDRRRHLRSRFKADNVNFARSQRSAESEMSTISWVATAATFSSLGINSSVAAVFAQHLARSRTCHIHGDVPATEYDNAFADGEFVAQVNVEQEIDALDARRRDLHRGW